MRKFIAAALISCAALAVPALAADPDTFQGPKQGTCVDIDSGDGGVGGGSVNIVAKVLGTGCPVKSPLYRLDVYDATGVTLLASTNDATPLGEDATGTTIGLSVPVSATTVCIVMTTGGGQHVFDRAPNDGCIALTTGGGAAFGGFN